MYSHTVTHASRNLTLDLLRALAIIIIIFNHVQLIGYVKPLHFYDYPFNAVIGFFTFFDLGGWTAVGMFFVLSGFLVSGLLFNEFNKYGTIDIKSFLIRRGFKIYPSFIFFIFATFFFELAIHQFFHSSAPVFTDSLKDLFFLHNYLDGRWGHTWSLDVEEFFFIIIPFIIYFMAKKGILTIKSFAIIYLVLMVFGVLCRWYVVYHATGYDFLSQYIIAKTKHHNF